MQRKTSLSPSESEVFRMLGLGLSTKEIARKRGRSVKTVEAQRERIKMKMGIRHAVALVAKAVEERIANAKK